MYKVETKRTIRMRARGVYRKKEEIPNPPQQREEYVRRDSDAARQTKTTKKRKYGRLPRLAFFILFYLNESICRVERDSTTRGIRRIAGEIPEGDWEILDTRRWQKSTQPKRKIDSWN